MTDKTELDINRGKAVGKQSFKEMLDYCLTELEEQGFADGVAWETEITEGLALEELIGSLVRAEVEFKELQSDLNDLMREKNKLESKSEELQNELDTYRSDIEEVSSHLDHRLDSMSPPDDRREYSEIKYAITQLDRSLDENKSVIIHQ